MNRSVLLLLCTAPLASVGQNMTKLEFLAGPERTIIDAPLKDGAHGPCTVVIDLFVDRNGHITSAQPNAELSACNDPKLKQKAIASAKSFAFTEEPTAPASQKTRMTLSYEPDPINDEEPLAPMEEPEVDQPTVKSGANEIVTVLDEPPAFPDGDEAFRTYIARTIKYPADALESGKEGKVFLAFIVNADGSLQDFTVVRGLAPSLDQEALRVAKSMPNWTPGKLQGRPVRAKMTVPIDLRIKR